MTPGPQELGEGWACQERGQGDLRRPSGGWAGPWGAVDWVRLEAPTHIEAPLLPPM